MIDEIAARGIDPLSDGSRWKPGRVACQFFADKCAKKQITAAAANR